MTTPSGPKQPPGISVQQGIQELIDLKTFTDKKQIASLEGLAKAAAGIPIRYEGATINFPIPLGTPKPKRSAYAKLAGALTLGYVLGLATCEGCHTYNDWKASQPVAEHTDIYVASPLPEPVAPKAKAPKSAKVPAAPKAPKAPPKAKAPVDKDAAPPGAYTLGDEEEEIAVVPSPAKLYNDLGLKVEGSCAFPKGANAKSADTYLTQNIMPAVVGYFSNQLTDPSVYRNVKEVTVGLTLDQSGIDAQVNVLPENAPYNRKAANELKRFVANKARDSLTAYMDGDWRESCKTQVSVTLKP